MNIVAVTACISGVAHTYMAAELVEKLAKKLSYKILIETQGALGIENALSQEQIDDADVVMIIADINIVGKERFAQARVLKMSISHFLQNSKIAMQAAKKMSVAPPQSSAEL